MNGTINGLALVNAALSPQSRFNEYNERSFRGGWVIPRDDGRADWAPNPSRISGRGRPCI
jgi:hypothetical protein